MTLRTRLSLIALAALTACQQGPPPSTLPPAPPVPEAPTPPAPISAGTPATLSELTAGDRGCYMTVTEASGEAVIHLGAFELCEDTALVGKRVQFTTTPTPVQAEACQGDPACTQTETVDLVTAVRAVE